MGKKKIPSRFNKPTVTPSSSSAASRPSNPFESIKQRLKHDVIGKHVRGNERDVGKARAEAIEKRKQSLQVELSHHEHHQQNTFMDRRFSEYDKSIDAEDKMLQRMQHERIKTLSKKRNRYEMEEEEEELTHRGTALSSISFESHITGVPDDLEVDDDKGAIDEDTVHREHFGGGENTNTAPAWMMRGGAGKEAKDRTKKEIMEEIIAKSKMYKAEKQQEKQQQVELINELDAGFDDIRGIMEYKDSKATTEAESKRQKETASKLGTEEAELYARIMKGDKAEKKEEKSVADTMADEMDEFIMEAKKMGSEMRARASERVKTPEEVAKEQKEKLDALERERIRRMKGDDIDDDDEEPESTATATGGSKSKRRQRREAEKAAKRAAHVKKHGTTDDDLEENWIIQSQFKQKEGDGGGLADEDDDDEGDESDVPDIDDTGDEDEEDDEKEAENEEEEDEEEEEEKDAAPATKKQKSVDDDGIITISTKPTQPSKPKKALTSDDSLPYVFPFPNTYDQLIEILNQYDISKHATIIERIMAYYHISVAPENRQKMERFYTILVDHFFHLCNTYARHPTSSPTSFLSSLSTLSRFLFELSEQLPEWSGRQAREKLEKMRKGWYMKLLNGVEDDDQAVSSTSTSDISYLPSAAELLYFKMISNIFPTSDARHNVTTSATLILSECLSRFPLHGGRDITATLYICTCLLHYVSDSHRCLPELITFLHALLCEGLSLRTTTDAPAFVKPTVKTFLSGSHIWKGWNEKKETITSNLLPLSLLFHTSNAHVAYTTSSFLTSSFSSLLHLITLASSSHSHLPSYIELFSPLRLTLIYIRDHKLIPSHLHSQLDTVITTLQTSYEHHITTRKPLVQATKQVNIKTLTPAFHETYQPGKDYDPNQERAQLKQLSKKVKREKKGALRELRRDASFIASEKERYNRAVGDQREKKRKEVWSQLEAQQHDSNLSWGSKKGKKGKKGKRK